MAPVMPPKPIPQPPRSGNAPNLTNKKKTMLENASAQELSVLVLTIQDEYAKLSKDKAIADETISSLHAQYRDAMDEIGSLHTRVHELESDNDDVRSTMDTLSSEFEKSAHEIASIEQLKSESDSALAAAAAQSQFMREALVAEIARLTADLSKTKDEVDELLEEKDSLEQETNQLHESLNFARRDGERSRLEATMTVENVGKELADLKSKFQTERNVVDQQKNQIDALTSELVGLKDDSKAAARSYESAISEMKMKLDVLQSETSHDLEQLEQERDELREKNDELGEEVEDAIERAERAERTARQLDSDIKEVSKDMDAIRDEYESKISDLVVEVESVRDEYEKKMDGVTRQTNEYRDRALKLQKELDEAKKEIEALDGDATDLQETVEAMEKNMSVVREDLSTRIEALREESQAEKVEYEERLEQLQGELEAKTNEARDAQYQIHDARDKILKMEEELDAKESLLDDANKKHQTTRDLYEARIDRMFGEMKSSKEEHMKEMVDLANENEELKKNLQEVQAEKRTVDYRVRRLEDDAESSKQLMDQIKAESEESRQEYEHVMDNLMSKMNNAKKEAEAQLMQAIDERDDARVELRKVGIEKRKVDEMIELLTADKGDAENKLSKLESEMDSTIRSYETKIDNVTLKYLEKIDIVTHEKEDIEDKLHTLQDEHENTSSQLRANQNELSANKYAYETRIKKLEDQLDDATDRLQQKIKTLERELDAVHNDKDDLLKEKKMLHDKVSNFEADLEDANIALDQITQQLSTEREENEVKIDDVTLSLSGVIDKLTTEREDLSRLVENLENDLDDREGNIDKLRRDIESQKNSYENRISHLNAENDEMNQNILNLSSAKKEAMDKIRGLEEEVSDADGAIDDAKAAIETLLEEKKAADMRIQDLKNERSKVDAAMEQLRKQMATGKKELEGKLFKVQSENEQCTHENILLKMEKKEALEKVASLEQEINQAESAIGDAKNALQRLLSDKEEANRRIESLEEDKEHAQATIEAMTDSMTQARVDYEAKIDSLMSGLATAREVQASRSVAGESRSFALTATEPTRNTTYSVPDSKTYTSWRDRNKSINDSSTRSASDKKPTYTHRSVQSFDRNKETGGKRELAVDIDNMTIASELTDAEMGSKLDRSSASSSKYGSRSRSAGRDRGLGKGEYGRPSTGYSNDSKSTTQGPSDSGSKLSNLDLARSFLSDKPGPQHSRSRATPQDRDTFDDSDARSVGGKSLGGASLYTDSKSRTGKFGGEYDGDLNSRGERHGTGKFIADNGNEYEGGWKNDKREGHGKAKYNTGDVYIGEWKNCKRHGHGTMYIENGDVYEGNWDNGFKDGPGTYKWKDGEIDISQYSSDYRVGEGVRWSADRRRAYRLIRGNVQEEISVTEAGRIANKLGLPITRN